MHESAGNPAGTPLFDREAVRYELRDRKSPITLAGTVYSEDFGMLNDTDNEALRNVLRALYPGRRRQMRMDRRTVL
ncbi:MAG: hypothetical protein ACLR8P_12610 [Clostridium fessum]